MASRKIPERMTGRICFVGAGPFLWFRFGPAKEMNPLAARRVEAFHFASLPKTNEKTWIKRFRPLSRPSSFLLVDAHAHSANGAAGPEGASIENASQRNGTKEKRLPDTSEARGS